MILVKCFLPDEKPEIIPFPLQSVSDKGDFTFNKATLISVENEKQAANLCFKDIFLSPKSSVKIQKTFFYTLQALYFGRFSVVPRSKYANPQQVPTQIFPSASSSKKTISL